MDWKLAIIVIVVGWALGRELEAIKDVLHDIYSKINEHFPDRDTHDLM